MALFFKENHCGSCDKAFCCFSCRTKHEIRVHKKTATPAERKILASISNVSPQINTSLPKIRGSVPYNLKKLLLHNLAKEKRRPPVYVFNDSSNCENQPPDDSISEKSAVKTFGAHTEISTDEKKTQQTYKMTRPALTEKCLNVTVSVQEDSKNSEVINISDCSEAIENSHADKMNISENQNLNATTAGNTPPRTQTFTDQSATNENSSVYCPCSENLTRPEIEPIKSQITDSMPIEILECTENKEDLEKSSIYFACSEYLNKGPSPGKLAGSDSEDGFEAFKNDSKLASTKLDMTVSFTPEPYNKAKIELRTETVNSIISIDAEYETQNLEEFSEVRGVESNNANWSDVDAESTISVQNSCVSSQLESCSSIEAEKLFKAPENLQTEDVWVRSGTTQTSFEVGRKNNLGLALEVVEESIESTPLNFKSAPPINQQNDSLSCGGPPATPIGDNSFWQSFSNSIQRAYNSTKGICSTIGRKNRSKRELDDIEELQPKPKRSKLSILCRPPIRENPRVVFRQDGDIRRPVIAFDKGTQTDFLY